METSTIGGIIGVTVFILGYILYGMYKSGKQMYKLQQMAELFNDEFKHYIYTREGWQISAAPRKGWYKLIDGHGEPYYIQFNGPIPFQTAVDFLMKGFVSKINREG